MNSTRCLLLFLIRKYTTQIIFRLLTVTYNYKLAPFWLLIIKSLTLAIIFYKNVYYVLYLLIC